MGNQERTHGNKRLESKRPGVTKAGQAAPKLKSVLDHGPSPNELPKVDDTKFPQSVTTTVAPNQYCVIIGNDWNHCFGPA